MSGILEARDLVKHFGKGSSQVRAVNGVSFTIREGICFGLLGPNGAGKTTTIEMMEGIKDPTSGQILFRGQPLGRDFKERAGIQFQSTSLPDFLKVREVLNLFHGFYKRRADLDELIKLCTLEEFLDRDAKKLSGGQKQRLLLAAALVNDPDIVYLDEPTTGLDPQARRNFWELVALIKKRGKTVVLTTHYMEEAFVLCDEIAIMDRGKIIAQGEPSRLLKEHFEGMTIELPREDVPSLAALERVPGRLVSKGETADGLVSIQTNHVNETMQALLDAGAQLGRMQVRSQTLEDLFLELTGKQLRG